MTIRDTAISMGILWVFFFLCSDSEANPYIKGDPMAHGKSNALVDNLDVKGVPKEFMDLVLIYIEANSNDAPYPGHEIEARKNSAEIVREIMSGYKREGEGYFLQIVKTNRNSKLRTFAYNIFLETELNSGLMLDYARKSLAERAWESNIYLDLDIGHQMKILVAYGGESDLDLWNGIWDQMDDRERDAFKNYGEMLAKALDNRNQLRVARGDKKSPKKLLRVNSERENSEREKPSGMLRNKIVVVSSFALLIIFLFYMRLSLKRKTRQV